MSTNLFVWLPIYLQFSPHLAFWPFLLPARKDKVGVNEPEVIYLLNLLPIRGNKGKVNTEKRLRRGNVREQGYALQNHDRVVNSLKRNWQVRTVNAVDYKNKIFPRAEPRRYGPWEIRRWMTGIQREDTIQVSRARKGPWAEEIRISANRGSPKLS